ncbi:hypothetical protein [Campylobacter fetus]|uniref:hypothetical protein n=1 Tax=Campylobacter fetus TaxID=196 RepID=UPI0008187CB1|nr:hypothetical protein [Campylobacter fetus]OCR88043.1 hypothetical protein CFT13S00388_02420 [Campylobacter fetus subsp. testudinum]RUT51012.1 hypothetical protein BWK67_00370 [Campylobacter fetus]RUT51740.1 hypothetical protein BWK51_00370 [Campylobacter fetus]
MIVTIENADFTILNILENLKTFKPNLKIYKEDVLPYNEASENLKNIITSYEDKTVKTYTTDEVISKTNSILNQK